MDLHVPSLYRTNSHDIVSPPEGSLSLGCLSLQPPFACECYVCLICNCPVCFIRYRYDLFSKFSQYIESFSFNQYNVLSPYNLLYSYDIVDSLSLYLWCVMCWMHGKASSSIWAIQTSFYRTCVSCIAELYRMGKWWYDRNDRCVITMQRSFP